MSLKKKTAGGLLWTTIDVIGVNAVRLLITIVLARILLPSDFGLIAVFSVFIVVSETLVHSGFSTALIRKLNATETDYNTIFTFNLSFSVILYLLVYIFSPYIATYFDQPLLKDIAKISGLVIVFNALGFIQNVFLRKTLNFRRLAIVNVASSIISGIIGVSFALFGYGVWSLVLQMISKSFISTALLWFQTKNKVKISFSQQSFIENFSFGYKVSLANIINSLSREAYIFVIGKVYSADNLGYYYQAKRLSDMSHKIISNVFNSVSYPVLSSIQSDSHRLINIYIQFVRAVSFISFPLMLLLLVVSPKLIPFLLSDKWLQSIPFFQLLCIGGMITPLLVISGNIPLVKGMSGLFLKLEMTYKVLMILALFITVWISIEAVIIGMVLQLIVQLVVNFLFVQKILQYSIRKQITALLDIFILSVIIAAIVYSLKFIINNSTILMFMQIGTYIGLYFISNLVRKSNELRFIMDVISRKIKK